MIEMKELLKGAKFEDQSPEIQANLTDLLKKMNKVRAAYGKPMTVTSGLRTLQDHLRIYKDKGITDQSKIPMKSRHLFGQAVDISDPDGSLYKWAEQMDKNGKLKEWGIWCEKDTKGWLHCQSVPYGSYKEGKSRFFYA